ncbi:MAG TPA: hypothetical protein VK615_08180, partial [Candidatus Binatia bacterium]|nr:hypothetical protein [Candidatus Binatia bacterium]
MCDSKNNAGADLPNGLDASRVERHFRTDHLLSNLGSRAFSGGMITIVSQVTRFALFMAMTVVL